ncbi:MAG: formylmethanofuran dehydrogenase subunit B [Thiogranum sp.]|nr:formylmethanofuran dehydrogenase subunit B [Thiogranum sp.]
MRQPDRDCRTTVVMAPHVIALIARLNTGMRSIGMIRARSESASATRELRALKDTLTTRQKLLTTEPTRPMDEQSRDMMLRDIVCPFCSLCCDDLTARHNGRHLEVADNGCAQAARGFAIEGPGEGLHHAQISGTPCTPEEAISHAAILLGNAQQPLFGGLGTDVAGARALLRLADHCGATFDHMNSSAMLRNLLVVQDSGWMTTTLTEVRNRADVLLVFGAGIEQHMPRFYQRIFNGDESMFAEHPPARELVLIGNFTAAPPVDASIRTTLIPCSTTGLGDIAMGMRALLNGATLQAETIAGVSRERLQTCVERLQAARYGVVAWTAAELDFPHAELAVQAFCELARSLNATTRCSGLPLGGNNADHTFAQVATWQTGYPTRTSLAGARPEYDPVKYNGERMLRDNEADALLWVSAFDNRRTPPHTDIPTIVLGPPGMQPGRTFDVFLPVATPGLDHAGHVFRCDTVAILPLRGLRQAEHPAVSDTVNALLKRL